MSFKSKFKYALNRYMHMSKLSLALRISASVILIVAIGLIIGLREPISRKIYNWGEVRPESSSQVHFISVGQGDATLFEFGDGKTALVDAGPSSSSEILVDYIKDQKINKIDYFFLTHADADHVGGGVSIFQSFEVGNFYRPMTRCLSESSPSDYPQHDTYIYNAVITEAYACVPQENIYYSSTALGEITDTNFKIKFLYPDKPYSSTNASSLAMMIEMQGYKFLMMGDCELKQENLITTIYKDQLKCDVLKLGHHGAATSTGTTLLSYAKPDYGVISVGENNYGHPSGQVLSNLKMYGVSYFNTLEEGDIVFDVDGQLFVRSSHGKMIDYALICVILGTIVLIIWSIPEPKHKKKKKSSKNNLVKN